ncbi:MAG: hypothetical protein AAF804_16685, partial [Bacteroidota bacterium]
MMNSYFLFLLLFCGFMGYVQAQELEVGGRVGATDLSPLTPSNETGIGTAGIFAAWKNDPLRLGMRVEVNYQAQPEVHDTWQVPIMGVLPLDKQKMVELHSGPYVGVRNQPEHLGPELRWGFCSGLQVNLPLSPHWVLSSEARANKDLSPDQYLTPEKRLSFELTFGLAYLIKRR